MTDKAAYKLLDVKGLKKYFPLSSGFLSRTTGYVKAVDDVSFDLYHGETLALVGESGCGKTTTGRLIIRLLNPTSGQILFRPDGPDTSPTDLAPLNNNELRPMRQHMQMVFQDPFTSLNPRKTVLEIVGEPLRLNNVAKGKDLEGRVAELLRLVGLRPEYLSRYPNAFSGGQRQRLGVARALALNPQLIIADEPVSALDVSVQAQILNLLKHLQQRLDLTYLFISHDLSVVKHISTRVAVMYVGKIVEIAPTKQLYQRPLHPYTEALLSAVHITDPSAKSQKKRIVLQGDVADPANPPSGCYFHPRCPYAEAVCKTDTPPLREIQPGRLAACHFAEELNLTGVAAMQAQATPVSD
ncbi:MAG: peptide ABC transporter ATP-binding protein [Anaerolineaceae bacterium]|nr:peptide ABC transporter ATP-binding protein [Anaerolineaceae bacterium]